MSKEALMMIISAGLIGLSIEKNKKWLLGASFALFGYSFVIVTLQIFCLN